MKYTSTRDASVQVDGATAVIDGISPGGGLYVPTSLPKIDYRELSELDYIHRADKILRAFFDFDVKNVADIAYKDFDGDPAPVVKLDDNSFVMELWHGKTCSFKDMSLSVLPRLLVKAKAAKSDTTKTLMLVATGGDTGKAAFESFKNVGGVEVCAFYPTNGERAQKLAMQVQDGNNVNSVGVTGSLNDVQTAVLSAFADESLKRALAENNTFMSSANSLNVGLLVPQIAYYFSAYCDLINAGEIRPGDKIDFIVPTGSFGNILAGYYALKMGVPINRLVCASNANNVLTDFISTGIYDINRELYKTESPSMDVLVSSNLERLIFEISGRSAEKTAERMESLSSTGRYDVTPDEIERIRDVFAADCATDEEIEEAVYDMFDEYGYLIDTHTAAAYAVAMRRQYVRPTVVMSTANPYKYAPAVLTALGKKTKEASEDAYRKLEELTAMDVPEQLLSVFKSDIRFKDVIEPKAIVEYLSLHYAKEQA